MALRQVRENSCCPQKIKLQKRYKEKEIKENTKKIEEMVSFTKISPHVLK